MFLSVIIVSSFIVFSIISIYLIHKYISFETINLNLVAKISIIYALITFVLPTIVLDRSDSSFAVMIWLLLGSFVMTYFEVILTNSFIQKTGSENNLKSIIKNFNYSLQRSLIIIFFWPFFIFIILYFNQNKNSKFKHFID